MAEQTKQPTTSSKLKEKFQQHLEQAKQRLEQAKQDIENLHEEDKESIRKKSAEIQQRVQAQKAQAQAHREQVSTWLRDKKQQTDEQVMSWRQKREVKHLERRADRAEEYAVSSVIQAMMDADEAEIAVLDAMDARIDVEVAVAPTP